MPCKLNVKVQTLARGTNDENQIGSFFGAIVIKGLGPNSQPSSSSSSQPMGCLAWFGRRACTDVFLSELGFVPAHSPLLGPIDVSSVTDRPELQGAEPATRCALPCSRRILRLIHHRQPSPDAALSAQCDHRRFSDSTGQAGGTTVASSKAWGTQCSDHRIGDVLGTVLTPPLPPRHSTHAKASLKCVSVPFALSLMCFFRLSFYAFSCTLLFL